MARDPSKQVIYNVPWQILRVQLLNEYNPDAGFDDLAGVRKNIKRLKKYLGKMQDINKVWRVLNLLNAVKFGYGKKDKGTDKEKAITKFQKAVSEKYKELKKTQEFKVEPKEEIIKDLKKAPRKWLELVYENLTSRYEGAKTPENRPELKDFILLLKKEMKKQSFDSSLKAYHRKFVQQAIAKRKNKN